MNMENIAHNGYDFEDLLNHPERLLLQGRCQETITKLCKDVGWSKKLQDLLDKCDEKYGKKVKTPIPGKAPSLQQPRKIPG